MICFGIKYLASGRLWRDTIKMQRLPREIIQTIIVNHLDLPSLARLSQTCKCMHKLLYLFLQHECEEINSPLQALKEFRPEVTIYPCEDIFCFHAIWASLGINIKRRDIRNLFTSPHQVYRNYIFVYYQGSSMNDYYDGVLMRIDVVKRFHDHIKR